MRLWNMKFARLCICIHVCWFETLRYLLLAMGAIIAASGTYRREQDLDFSRGQWSVVNYGKLHTDLIEISIHEQAKGLIQVHSQANYISAA